MPAKIEIDKEEFTIKVNEGLTVNQLADYFNCSPGVINSRKKKWGLSKQYGTKKSIDRKIFLSLFRDGYTNEQLANHFKTSVGPIKSLKRELKLTTIVSHNKIDIDEEELIRLVNLGYSLKELADHFKCLPLVISRRKEDLKLTKSSKVLVDNEKLIESFSLGFSANEIAEDLFCTSNVIVNRKRELGIKYKITEEPNGVITKEFILSILDFSNESFPTWKERRGSVTIGDIAGSINNNGHVIIEINNIAYTLSHLVILIHEGKLPKRIVFHLNEDLLDNSYENLRISDPGSDYFERRRKQTPKNVNKKLMKAIWKNCPKGWHVDHIHPLSKGGLNEPNNLQYLTQNDNNRKSSKANFKNYIINPIKWQDIINENEYKIL